MFSNNENVRASREKKETTQNDVREVSSNIRTTSGERDFGSLFKKQEKATTDFKLSEKEVLVEVVEVDNESQASAGATN